MRIRLNNVEVTESSFQKVCLEDGLNKQKRDRHLLLPIITFVTSSALLFLVVFRETAASMIDKWHEGSYSHGYLVLPIVLWLVYVDRKRLAGLRISPSPWALFLLMGLAGTWLLGDLAGVQAIRQGSIIGMLGALVWLIFGTRIARALLFPLLFLFFAVPMGEALVPRLQDITAFFAVKGLDIVGVPVILEKRLITVPSGVWEVAQACSGLRYLIASIMLGCFYAYVVYRSLARRIIFVLVAVALPIVANGIRAFGIILLGHLTDNRLAAGVDHVIYGGVFFGLIIFILFAAGWRWREPGLFAGAEHLTQAPEAMDNSRTFLHPESRWRPALWAALGIALVSIAPLSARRLDDPVTAPAKPNLELFSVLPPWNPQAANIGSWQPVSVAATGELKQTYTDGGRRVSLYVAYYTGGKAGRKLVSSSNAISEHIHWSYVGERRSHATIDGKTAWVHETALRSGQANLLVWSWYWIGGQFTDDPYRAKALFLKTRLIDKTQTSAIVAVGAYYSADRSEARNALQDFLSHTSLQENLKRSSN